VPGRRGLSSSRLRCGAPATPSPGTGRFRGAAAPPAAELT
jgi:hypothetical protein